MYKLWYKDAIIYALAIQSFKDTNSDGIGDLTGLQTCIPYFKLLGIDCLWLLPFYDSPQKDDGYDVRDYYSVDPRIGDLGDFVAFLDNAKGAGLKVIIDLVINHTSTEHPWFKDAIRHADSPYRSYYIWADQKPEEENVNAILGEEQGFTNWTYSKEAGAFYYHTFYPDQPDLNMTNPQVVAEVKKIMHFWLKLGVDGFRIDAAPHIIKSKGGYTFDHDPHDVFREWRSFLEAHNPQAIFLAEVDVPPKRYTEFLEENKQMHLLFNFYLNNYFFLACAREDGAPIARALRKIPTLKPEEHLANFLRNHDELDLEQLTPAERQEVFAAFAPEEHMRIFDRGIRRRLPPMFENNQQRLAMAYSLLFSLPGTPVLRYGQEIGMGDNLQKQGRKSVRTVMQWNDQKNAGFSDVTVGALDQELIADGPFRYEKINVQQQISDKDSLLHRIRSFIDARKANGLPEGKFSIIDTDSTACIVYRYERLTHQLLFIHNLSNKAVDIRLPQENLTQYEVILADTPTKARRRGKHVWHVNAFGYVWLRTPWTL
ncbi:alpha-amylase family protein [Sphingobacterium suaedae]|uniref:Alpha-amylase family protein n=1 Tax=Sphingobacterium suaedae TaxID=1686402 RepID=A0ABW5KEJ5_9SPHI